jgi:hypothetical protein
MIGSNWHKSLAIFTLLLCLLYGCSNEVDLYGEGESIPVVYCLLNPLEGIQFVRVAKTFLSSGERLETGIPADSILWPVEASVYIEKWENNNLVETIVFEVSDILEKDTGLFPIDGLRVYSARFKPVPGEEYHLYVYFDEYDKIVSAETAVMDIPELVDPVNVPGRKISFDTIAPLNIRWKTSADEGLYQGFFKMHYSELVSYNLSFHNCIFATPVFFKTEAAEIYEEKLRGLNFLQSVSQQVKPVKGAVREAINFEFIFYATGPELAILVSSETGISNPFVIVRNSSNIAGGVGVFSSICYHRIPNLEPSKTTRYFLATSRYTNQLGFQSE